MNIILFGYKGCGKTTYGKQLAKRLGIPFVDTDALACELFESTQGRKLAPKAIYQHLGESGFRSLERDVIASLQNLKQSVIAVGGGLMIQRDLGLEMEKLGICVFLDVEKELLKERVLSGELPAYLDPMNPEQSFEKMYEMRRPLYDGLNSKAVEIDTGTTDSEVLDTLEEIYVVASNE